MGFVQTVLEVEEGNPLALVQYRQIDEGIGDLKQEEEEAFQQELEALGRLGDGYGPDPLPAVLAWYHPTTWSYFVHPLNEAAREISGKRRFVILTETQFFWALRALRSADIGYQDHDVARKCLNLPFRPVQDSDGPKHSVDK